MGCYSATKRINACYFQRFDVDRAHAVWDNPGSVTYSQLYGEANIVCLLKFEGRTVIIKSIRGGVIEKDNIRYNQHTDRDKF